MRMKQLEEQKLQYIQLYQRKIQMARDYQDNYGGKDDSHITNHYIVKASEKEMNECRSDVEFEMLLKRKVLRFKLIRCALKLQTQFRMWRKRRDFVRYRDNRESAALRLQRFWKRYHMWQMIPRALKERKERAAIEIQKYLRSYISNKYFIKIFAEYKLKNCHDYFSKIKLDFILSAQILISYSWKRYLKRKS